jgi:hypothetical protein
MKSSTRRPTRAALDHAYAISAQGSFEAHRATFVSLIRTAHRGEEAREAAALAIAAGEQRIAEVAGTEHEAGWVAAVENLRAMVGR